MSLHKIILIALVSAALCTACARAFAASPFLPAGQSLEAQAERFRQQYSEEKRAREKAMAKALVEYEEKEKAAEAAGPSFILHSVTLTGTTIFNTDNLSFIWKPYLGKKVNFKDLNDIVKLIKRAYKDMGYLTTTAYLPPQKVEGGDVQIKVVEGKLGNLAIEGNKYFSTPSIKKYFHTYRGEVLDMGEIEKDMMRLNASKDLNVSSVLSPGEDPETVDVTLKAKENFPYHVSIGTDNQGSRLTGRFRRLVTLDTSNLTGREDSLLFSGAYTDLSSGNYVSYQTPVGTHGMKVGFDAGYFQGKLGQEYKPFDVTNDTELFDPNATFELHESENLQMDVRTGVQIKNNHKKEAMDKLMDEKLRLPYAALDVARTDATGQTYFSPELSFGFPGFLDASREDNLRSSRPGVDGYFAKYSHYFLRNQMLPFGTHMQVRSQFQAASHTLPTSEQLQLGGANSVRGYPEGDFLADVGGNVNVDWYLPMPLVPSNWEFMGTHLKDDIEPLVFYDVGFGRVERVFAGERRDKYLSGVGGGVRIRLRNNFYLKLEWARAIGDKPISGTGPSSFDVSFQVGT